MGWIACYSTHNYELFAFRSWIVAYLAFALSGEDIGYIQPSLIVFFGVLLGMPTSVIGNELSMRFGRPLIVNSIMGLSAVFAFLIGNSFGMAAPLLIGIVLVYGCFVTGESASITTGAIESATEDSRGVTLAVHSSIGFIGSFLGPVGFGIVLNYFGGHNIENAWFWAFASTGIILLIGPLLNFYLRNYKLEFSEDLKS
jgi:MFS family permease